MTTSGVYTLDLPSDANAAIFQIMVGTGKTPSGTVQFTLEEVL